MAAASFSSHQNPADSIIGRTIQNFRGHGNDLYQTLRYESVRATVGAIQICTREGLEAALGEADGGEPYPLPEGLEIPIG